MVIYIVICKYAIQLLKRGSPPFVDPRTSTKLNCPTAWLTHYCKDYVKCLQKEEHCQEDELEGRHFKKQYLTSKTKHVKESHTDHQSCQISLVNNEDNKLTLHSGGSCPFNMTAVGLSHVKIDRSQELRRNSNQFHAF